MSKPLHPLAAAAVIGAPSAIFLWMTLVNADLSAWRYLSAETRPGVVEYCERTRYSVGGPTREHGGGKGDAVFRHHFVFDPGTGARVSGVSYQAGVCLEKGQAARIEHPPGDPARARIVGQRAKPYSGWLALLALLPAGGLLIAGVLASHALTGRPALGAAPIRRRS